MLTKERANELLEYREGVLYWKTTRSRLAIAGSKVGMIGTSGYLQTKIDGARQMNHRVIFLMHHGYMPTFVDHIDNNKLNNRIENLREATKSQNGHNVGIRSSNTSGVKGVYWKKSDRKWCVRAWCHGKRRYFGLYDDLELADLVAREARNKFHREYANHGKK